MSTTIGINASLSILRQELEAMQRQDKALYSQLLTLRDSIRGLKTELKHEREECEEAFNDLEQSLGTFEDDVFLEGSEEQFSKTSSEKNENAWNTWKHDRQDSGISVKTPEAENQESRTTTPTSKNHIHVLTKSSAGRQDSKPELISHSKQEFSSNVKTVNIELPQKKTTNGKRVLIQHSSQDSGILIDEDSVRDTSLLSKLVESSEMLENRKFDRIVRKEWMKMRENSSGNRAIHQRSRSSNDLLKPQRNFFHQYSTPSLYPRHSHTNSCPQNTLMQFTTPGNEPANLKQLNGLKRESPKHSRTNSCPQNVLKQLPERDVQTFEIPLNEPPSGKELDEKQHFKLPVDVNKPLKTNERLENSLKDSSPVHKKSFTPSKRAALSLPLGTGSTPSKSVFKQNAQHHHTRSLPTTPVRELILAENLLNRQDNRRSMQNISEGVTSKQIRPRKRSASYVDLGMIGNDATIAPQKASLVQVDSLKQALEQGKIKPDENSFTSHIKDIENANSKQSRENDEKDSSQMSYKANVVQVDSFSGFNQGQDLKDKKSRVLTSHKAIVVQVNTVPQGEENTQNRAKVVHINRLKHPQETQNLANENVDLQTSKPLRAVRVSATEVNVSKITDKQPLSRRSSFDERAVGNHRDGPQRRFTITNFKTERLSSRAENGKLSPRFLTPKNHLRHHTSPDNDDIRRRHSLYAFHAPSKSWDGTRRANDIKKIVRSASQVSLV